MIDRHGVSTQGVQITDSSTGIPEQLTIGHCGKCGEYLSFSRTDDYNYIASCCGIYAEWFSKPGAAKAHRDLIEGVE